MEKSYYVYILTNKNNSVLYTGVTNNLSQRIFQHRLGKGSNFTRHYNLYKLVYAEHFYNVFEAITREKQIKAGSRKNKINLIQKLNPTWKDLAYLY